MPLLSTMAERANASFSRANVRSLKADHFAAATTLRGLLEALDIAKTDAEKDFLDRWPPVLQQTIRAVFAAAHARGEPVAVSWAPGYDYEVQVWEAKDTETKPGGITLLLRSRYPADALP